MYPGESISLLIQSGQSLRIPQSCIPDSQVSPSGCHHFIYHLKKNKKKQKTKNSFMAHLEC